MTVKNKIKTFFLLLILLASFIPNSISYADEGGNSIKVNFVAETGGLLEHNGELARSLTISVDSGTPLESIYPEVKPDDHYKFKEWKNASSSSEDGVIVGNMVREYRAVFYPDFNDNNIDDTTEKIKVNFEPNNDQKINPIEITVGKMVEVPEVKKADSIFLGWFTDKEMNNQFEPDSPITKDTTLYAKWDNIDSILSNKNVLVIREKDVSNDIEKKLNEQYEKTVSEKEKSIEESKKKANETSANGFVEVKQVFENLNASSSYVIKYQNEKGEYLFSLVLPYGKTIETYNDNDFKVSENSVRQTSTMNLDSDKYLTNQSDLDYYEVKTVQENAREIVKIFPVLKEEKVEEEKVSYKDHIDLTESEPTKAKNELGSVWLIFGGLIALVLLGIIAFYIFRKPKKLKQEGE